MLEHNVTAGSTCGRPTGVGTPACFLVYFNTVIQGETGGLYHMGLGWPHRADLRAITSGSVYSVHAHYVQVQEYKIHAI